MSRLFQFRRLFLGQFRPKSTSSMRQVEVDEPEVQRKLGRIQMNLVKKAEKQNLDRAVRHRKFRRGDWVIASVCFGLAVGIYAYTIYGIKQEKFLDDFEMPDPLEEQPQQQGK